MDDCFVGFAANPPPRSPRQHLLYDVTQEPKLQRGNKNIPFFQMTHFESRRVTDGTPNVGHSESSP